VLGMFLKGWSAKLCAQKFSSLGRQLFEKGHKSSWRWVSKLNDLLWCFLADGHYDTQLLDNLLRNSFGPSLRMFGTKSSLLSGNKIAVTATTISNASPCIFTNYNGPEFRSDDLGQWLGLLLWGTYR
jgi:hypothetical protein